jgi:hypothetical protein
VSSASLMMIGEKLGLYKALAHAEPPTCHEVAERSGTAERYVREWLRNQAAGGYFLYDGQTDRYTRPHEHAYDDSPIYHLGAYEAIASVGLSELVIIRPLAPGRCRTAVIDVYNNLLELENAYPGENWNPLRRAVAKEPSIQACAPRPPRQHQV